MQVDTAETRLCGERCSGCGQSPWSLAGQGWGEVGRLRRWQRGGAECPGRLGWGGRGRDAEEVWGSGTGLFLGPGTHRNLSIRGAWVLDWVW